LNTTSSTDITANTSMASGGTTTTDTTAGTDGSHPKHRAMHKE
jgi:hypothetical protein